MTLQKTTNGFIYVANDGMKFTDREKCKNHEKTWFDNLVKKFKNIPHSYMSEEEFLDGAGSDIRGIYLVKPRNMDDIKVINELFDLQEFDRLDSGDINRESAIQGEDIRIDGAYCGLVGFKIYGGIDSYTEMIRRHIKYMRDEL